MSVFGKKGLKVENVISGFKNTGTFPIDRNKYKISRLDNVKLISYNLGKANGAPVDENGSPALTTENKSNQTNLVNTSDVDCSHLTSAIISSVVDAPSPQVKKSCKKLPFSTELYLENFSRSSWCATPAQENKGQSCSTQPSCSTPTSQDTLNLLQQNAPPGFKYYVTLELRETNSLEKVLKNRMLTKNTNKKDSSAPPPKWQKILMHGAIITNSDYGTQIAKKALAGKKHKEAEQKEKKKAKKNKNLKKEPNKSTRKEFREMLRRMGKDNNEEDNTDMSTDEESAEKQNDVKENETETKVACSGIYPEKRNESVNSLLTFSIADLDDFNVGKCFAGILAKTKSLLLGKIAQSIFCWCWQSCSGSWNPVS